MERFQRQAKPDRHSAEVGCWPNEGTRAASLWADAAIAFRLLSRIRWLDGFRLVANAQYGALKYRRAATVT
jgi:hypothetical protein